MTFPAHRAALGLGIWERAAGPGSQQWYWNHAKTQNKERGILMRAPGAILKPHVVLRSKMSRLVGYSMELQTPGSPWSCEESNATLGRWYLVEGEQDFSSSSRSNS